jgi:N-acyl-D-aspartate/D-glutamate deacylase
MLDLKIIGGTVVDGTGAEGRHADVAMRDGKVVALAEDASVRDAEAAVTIDASDRVVTPGFVDIHTHYDAQILWDRMLSVSPWHGVTTVVMGNCGFGVAPTLPAHRDLIVRTLEKVEGMSADALRAGLGEVWPFETFPEYLDAIDAHGSAINVAAMIGHTPVRLATMGTESTERTATDEEVAQMRATVAQALEAGAIGFATSKSATHVGYEGRPVPSRAAEFAEIATIAGALSDAGRGVMQATMGSGLSFDEFAAISRATGRPISWTALLAGVGAPGVDRMLLDESIKLLDAGVAVHPQVSCRPLTFEFTMAEPFPFESMKLFGQISSARDDEQKKSIYRDPTFRRAFREGMANGRAGLLGGSWDRGVVSWFPLDPELENRNIAELAAERQVDPSELVLDMALESGLDARFRMAVLNYDEDMVEVLLTDPHTMLGLSDAGAHASQLCDACFSTHLLSRWVRERKALTLEAAVRQLTSEPAEIFGLTDRGVLAEGRPADIVVLDPATVGCSDLRRVDDQPAGAERLVADASGIEAVVVNGVLLRRDGVDVVDPSGPLPGRLLRHGAAST